MLSNAPQNPLWASPLTYAPAALQAAYPWEVPPPDSEPFDFFGVLETPAMGDEGVVLSFVVPAGYRGVIRDLGHYVEGPSLAQGSGDLIWSLKFDRAYVKNYGSIKVSFGDLAAPRAVYGLRLQPGQTVYYSVKNVAYAPVGTRIICNARGWFYPEVASNVVA